MPERRERRRLRELGVRALYQAEVVGEDLQDALSNVLEHARKVSDEGGTYLRQVLRAFDEHRGVIDAALESQAANWTLKRMAATDRNVLRWAAAELWYRPDVPRAVVLDEAIELAKELSGPESGKFVNGILDRLPAEPPPLPEPPEPHAAPEVSATEPGEIPPGDAAAEENDVAPESAAPESVAPESVALEEILSHSKPLATARAGRGPSDADGPVAILSDIHGNLEALEAVLAEVAALGVRRVVCLGDIVGYGASPSECCERVAAVAEARVLGNHDEACLGRGDLEYFNSVARTAALWTLERLTPEARAYLDASPMTQVLETGGVSALLVHASPDHPGDWHYVISEHDARLAFEACEDRLVFVGHSHVPGVFTLEGGMVRGGRVAGCDLGDEARHLVNVGSVGQPRDRRPEASFAVLDPAARRVEIRRVPYDIEAAQARIREAGLPQILAARLSWGE